MTENLESNYESLVEDFTCSVEIFARYIQSIPKNLREVTIIGKWSVKDILAHFSRWNLLTIFDIQAVLKGDMNSVIWVSDDSIDSFNEASVLQRRVSSWEAVYLEFIQTSKKLVELYASLSDDEWELFLRKTPEEELKIRESIEIDIDHFKNAHLPEMQEAIKLLIAQNPTSR